MENRNEQFSNRIISLMRERRINQKQLAEGIDITEAALSRYLNGERTPRIDVVIKSAAFFDVSIDYILGNETTENNPITFQKLKNVLARQSKSMTSEEKLELMRIINK